MSASSWSNSSARLPYHHNGSRDSRPDCVASNPLASSDFLKCLTADASVNSMRNRLTFQPEPSCESLDNRCGRGDFAENAAFHANHDQRGLVQGRITGSAGIADSDTTVTKIDSGT